jgi:hypothetical protein
LSGLNFFQSPGCHGHGLRGIILKNFSAQTLHKYRLITLDSSLLPPFSRIPPFKIGPVTNTGHPACQAFFRHFGRSSTDLSFTFRKAMAVPGSGWEKTGGGL